MLKYRTKELRQHLFIDMLIKNEYRVVRHCVFLVSFFLLTFFARFWHWYSEPFKYYILCFVYISLIVMVYINIYVLVPFFFFKKHYISYFFLLILLGVIGLNLIEFCFKSFFSDYKIYDIRPEDNGGGLYEGYMMCISVVLISTTFKLLQKWTRDTEKIVELNQLTMTMELNGLRNQINPHFLFNMLNNVKALIRTDADKATAVIIKLSEFLRYQLYENNEEKTLLSSEIEFLSNFVALEKIRRENFSTEIKSETNKKTLNSTFLPPNLFTTFVENAIKHSVDLDNNLSYVNINIEVKNRKLSFICINSQNQNYAVSKTIFGGLGLANIKRRLELLYPDQFELDITSTEKEYRVTLIIPL